MADTSLITDALQRLLNIEFGPQIYEIEKGMLRKFTEAIGDPNPLWQQIAPPTFYAVLRLEELTLQVMTADCPANFSLHGGNEFEYFKPIKTGDTISVTGKLINLQEKFGENNDMLFATLELKYSNQQKELVGKMYNTIIRY
jgi:N-terminal half of MaoC dehydratase